MSTRFARVVAVFAALALVGAGVALAAAVTVKSAKNPTYGRLVVNSSGFTLYHNTKEKGSIKCTGSCAKIWPPLYVGKTQKVKAGPGINLAKLGKIKRPNGRFQVTYAGKPLYRYSGDTKAGTVNGEGIGGIWFAIKANGALAKAPVGTTTNTTTTNTTTTGY
jgi:predicted lipoprotein with Yx(FWY)xxD motif